MATIRVIGPLVLALATTVAIDRLTQHRGLLPPRFRLDPTSDWQGLLTATWRRGLALVILASTLWVGVFAPLGTIGTGSEIDLSRLTRLDLFLLHLLLLVCLVVWYAAGFLPHSGDAPARGRDWRTQLGMRAESIRREVGLGLVVGVGAWLAVLGVLVVAAVVIWWLGGEEILPQEPPALIPWIAALPWALRVSISLSAGIVEEIFFRGFLQPRVGIALSTVLFVLAHASYEQPLLLVGVGLLSLAYASLVYWRQTVWPAIAAHTLFDAVQLLVVIPSALEVLPEPGQPGMVAGWISTLG